MRNIRSFFLLLLLVFLGLPILSANAFAQGVPSREEITKFVSQINVQPDATVVVKETITVIAQGEQIKHGIYRDLPTETKNRSGQQTYALPEVLSVSRGGVPITYTTKHMSGAIRVYLGTTGVPLTPGQYTYELVYAVKNQISFFEDHDEIDWNVTGNEWLFPIDVAEGDFFLPSGAKVLGRTAFTGHLGERGVDYIAERPSETTLSFRTSRVLNRGEGLTAYVSFSKGVVTPTPNTPSLLDRFEDYVLTLWSTAEISLFFGMAAYYLFLFVYGPRYRGRRAVIPLFAPPENLSPAAVNYLMNVEKETPSCFCAAVINMAVKGQLKIFQQQNGWDTITVLKRLNNSKANLSSEEQILFDGFFNKGGCDEKQIVPHDPLMCDTAKVFREDIARQFGSTCYVLDIISVIIGVGLSMIGCALETVADGEFHESSFVIVWLINFAGGYSLRRRTTKGELLLNKIEGFKLYLSVAEKDRLTKMNAPSLTPQVYEKFLPYAIALGVVSNWTSQFSSMMESGPWDGYSPLWFGGDSFDLMDMHSFVDTLSSDVGCSMTEINPVLDGGSSFGGGFSGLGGGGGGGGGF